jgi:hypothetical protein
MNRHKITIAMLGLLTACFAPSMRADERNKETHFTIDQPLQVLDTVLAPGQYVVKLVEPDTDHSIVSIYNSGGTQLQKIIMGVPAYRTDAGGKELLTVSQSQGDQPATLKYWFYPGDNSGVEFPVRKLVSEGKKQTADAGVSPSQVAKR